MRKRLSYLGGLAGIDFLNDAIGSGGDTFPTRSDVDDDEYRRRDRPRRHDASYEFVDAQVVGTDLRTGGVESHDAFLGIDLAEHGQHVLEVIVIEVEYRRIPRILLERDREGIGRVDPSARGGPEEDADRALARPSRHAMVVIRRGEQNERMDRYVDDI